MTTALTFGQSTVGRRLVSPVEVTVSVGNLTGPIWQDWFSGCVLTKFCPGEPVEIMIKVKG